MNKEDTGKWYILNVTSRSEEKILNEILNMKKEFPGQIIDCLVPKEDTLEVSKGQKKLKEKIIFSGYVFLKLHLSLTLKRKITKFGKLLGSEEGSELTSKEVEDVLLRVKQSKDNPRANVSFSAGEEVRVCAGPFSSFYGLVEEVNHEKGKIKAKLSILGRFTSVVLDIDQVEKDG